VIRTAICALAAIAQNLRKFVKMIGFSPPPLSAACVVSG
jgi:hypothetical protein